jgi:hypothetical protein
LTASAKPLEETAWKRGAAARALRATTRLASIFAVVLRGEWCVWSEGGGDGIQRVKLDIESEVSGKAATKPIEVRAGHMIGKGCWRSIA